MRCKDCDNENPDGVAFCETCGGPLTGYGSGVPGLASEATLAKLRKAARLPPIVPIMAVLCLVAAFFGPLEMFLGRLTARPTVNAEGTNYVASTFGMLGVIFYGIALI